MIDPLYLPPYGPNLSYTDLTREEYKIASAINDGLHGLGAFSTDFTAAVYLLNYAQASCKREAELYGRPNEYGSPYTHWQFIAARDATMAVFNFCKAMTGVRSLIGKCPPWIGKIDHKALRQAEKAYGARFPYANPLRHTVAHAGEINATPEKRDKNALKGSADGPVEVGRMRLDGAGASISLDGCLYNDVYQATFEGELISCAINLENAAFLVSTTRASYDAFQELDSTTPDTRAVIEKYRLSGLEGISSKFTP